MTETLAISNLKAVLGRGINEIFTEDHCRALDMMKALKKSAESNDGQIIMINVKNIDECKLDQ